MERDWHLQQAIHSICLRHLFRMAQIAPWWNLSLPIRSRGDLPGSLGEMSNFWEDHVLNKMNPTFLEGRQVTGDSKMSLEPGRAWLLPPQLFVFRLVSFAPQNSPL